uniref:Uncharacterized protein n=1 Tax=Cucumis melo TaxID=3656 RepID=A0A9I9E506_CUCME
MIIVVPQGPPPLPPLRSPATVNNCPCLCSRSSFRRAAVASSQQPSPESSPHLHKQPVTSIVPSAAVSPSALCCKSSIAGSPSRSSLGVVSKCSSQVDVSPSCATQAALLCPELHGLTVGELDLGNRRFDPRTGATLRFLVLTESSPGFSGILELKDCGSSSKDLKLERKGFFNLKGGKVDDDDEEEILFEESAIVID